MAIKRLKRRPFKVRYRTRKPSEDGMGQSYRILSLMNKAGGERRRSSSSGGGGAPLGFNNYLLLGDGGASPLLLSDSSPILLPLAYLADMNADRVLDINSDNIVIVTD